MFSFFFQAEDGIRDVAVTGVQTCALPILTSRERQQLTDDGRTAPCTERNFVYGGLSVGRDSGALQNLATHQDGHEEDRKSTRLNSSHGYISYAVFCLKKKKKKKKQNRQTN